MKERKMKENLKFLCYITQTKNTHTKQIQNKYEIHILNPTRVPFIYLFDDVSHVFSRPFFSLVFVVLAKQTRKFKIKESYY